MSGSAGAVFNASNRANQRRVVNGVTLNLQAVLAIIGAALVGAIYWFSKWERRRRAVDSEKLDASSGRDSPSYSRRESSRGAPSLGIADADHLATERLGGVVATAGRPAEAAMPAEFLGREVRGFERLSQIDYWVKISGGRDIGRESALAIYREAAAGISKPCGIHGLKAADNTWCDLDGEAEDARFGDLVLSIQLADRSGAIDERELARFSALAAKLATGTGREAAFMTPTENAVSQAAALADFIRHFAAVFVVNVRPGESRQFAGEDIERCAPLVGLEKDRHYYSRFKSMKKTKVTLYSLADMSETGHFDFTNMASFSTRGLIFFTKPAGTRSPGAVFTEMVDTAMAFASRVKGSVALPGKESASQENIDATRASIDKLVAQMAALGVAAGSDEARRIF